jgi:hypothetical protein
MAQSRVLVPEKRTWPRGNLGLFLPPFRACFSIRVGDAQSATTLSKFFQYCRLEDRYPSKHEYGYTRVARVVDGRCSLALSARCDCGGYGFLSRSAPDAFKRDGSEIWTYECVDCGKQIQRQSNLAGHRARQPTLRTN